MKITLRSIAVASGTVLAAGIFALPTTSANAMATLNCNQKGTSGDDTINVSVPADRATPWVVCAGAGVDTINVITVQATGTPSKLYLAMGAGQKTVNWLAGDLGGAGWGAPFFPWGQAGSEGIIVRPNASPNIIMGGSNTSEATVGFVCAPNTSYIAATDQENLYVGYGAIFAAWEDNGTVNNGC